MSKYFQKLFISIILASLYTSGAFAFDTSKQWLNLLHYSNGESLISDTNFFLHSDGQISPEKELEENIKQLSKTQNLSCKFPARTVWLQKNIKNFAPATPLEHCTEFQEYLTNLSAKSMHIVFATEKVDSPLSMMGHAFLKIEGVNGAYTPKHSLSFFANLGNLKNVLSFIPKSLSTGMDGLYILEPYSKRFESYALKDKRNLISYKINLTPNELTNLTYHIWEMKNVNVAYNLKSHNCASALITLLQAVNPKYSSIAYKSYLTPSDIINEANKNGFLGQQHQHLASGYSKYSLKESGSSHINIRYKQNNANNYLNFDYSLAYHDLMDSYYKNIHEFEVKLFSIEGNYISNKLNIQKLTLFGTKLLTPSSIEEKTLSTSFEVSLDNERFNPENSSLKPLIKYGKGFTLQTPFKKAFMPYIFIEAGYTHNDKNTFMAVPTTGLISYINKKNKVNLEVQKFITNHTYKYQEKANLKYEHHITPNRSISVNSEYRSNKYEHITDWSIGYKILF